MRDDEYTLLPGDWCDDCQDHVAMDGECECNQDWLIDLIDWTV